MKNIIVAIDGPCCSGKSTISENLARNLGFKYIDSGLLYRACAFICIKEGIDLEFEQFDEYVMKLPTYIDFDGKSVVYKGVEIPKSEIKSEKHAMVTAKYATSKSLRDCLTQIIREVAVGESVVVDGRDCCSNIFPEADYKFYFDISTETRIKRWMSDLSRQVQQSEIDEGINNINARDDLDKNRAYFPLKIEPDMKVVKLDELTIQDATMKIKKEILIGESTVYMKKTSKQVRSKKSKFKSVRIVESFFKKNVLKIENPDKNTLILGKGKIKESFITIYGEGNYVK